MYTDRVKKIKFFYDPSVFGSVANWFSGIGTMFGIFYSIHKSKENSSLHFEFTTYIRRPTKLDPQTALKYTVTNKANVNLIPDVTVQLIGISIRKHPWGKSELNRENNFNIGLKNNEISLDGGKLAYQKLVSNVGWFWAGSPEYRKIKYFYAVPFVLGMDGVFYYDKKYTRYKLSDFGALRIEK